VPRQQIPDPSMVIPKKTMKKNLTDPRAKRTRRLLQLAVRDLVAERAREKISVSDIVQRAGVGRTAFYEHFQDKAEALKDYERERFREFVGPRISAISVFTEEALRILATSLGEYLTTETLEDRDGTLGQWRDHMLQAEIVVIIASWIRRSHELIGGRMPSMDIELTASSWAILGATKHGATNRGVRDAASDHAEEYARRAAAMVYAGLLPATGFFPKTESSAAPGPKSNEDLSGLLEWPEPLSLRIGYMARTTSDDLRLSGKLEEALVRTGTKVSWHPFASSPALLEALGVGIIEAGIVGQWAPLFAQAAGVPLVYVAKLPSPPRWDVGLVVPSDSTVLSVRDLRGRSVCATRGACSHHYLLQFLSQSGLSCDEVAIHYLPQIDAKKAFGRGELEAWVAGDPHLTVAKNQLGARLIVDVSSVEPTSGYVVASRRAAEQKSDLLRAFIEEYLLIRSNRYDGRYDAGRGVRNPAANGMESEMSAPPESKELTNCHPIGASLAARLQQEADSLFAMGLLPNKISIQRSTLTAREYSNIVPSESFSFSANTQVESRFAAQAF